MVVSFAVYILGNSGKDRQRFVDAVVLISAPDWSVKLSNFENLLETPFEFGLRMLGFAKLCNGNQALGCDFVTSLLYYNTYSSYFEIYMTFTELWTAEFWQHSTSFSETTTVKFAGE